MTIAQQVLNRRIQILEKQKLESTTFQEIKKFLIENIDMFLEPTTFLVEDQWDLAKPTDGMRCNLYDETNEEFKFIRLALLSEGIRVEYTGGKLRLSL